MSLETKEESINWALIRAVWGVRYMDWAFLPLVGRLGEYFNSMGCKSGEGHRMYKREFLLVGTFRSYSRRELVAFRYLRSV